MADMCEPPAGKQQETVQQADLNGRASRQATDVPVDDSEAISEGNAPHSETQTSGLSGCSDKPSWSSPANMVAKQPV
eukprot:6294597-Heterocapsa_arctica.AAC.1